MNLKLNCLLILLSMTVMISSYGKSKNVLLKLDGQEITVEEFESSYLKNNSEVMADSLKLTVDEYLKLFIAYRLKVREAEESGYDTLSTFVKEFKGYRDELAKSYLTDRNYSEQQIEEAYTRVSTELKGRHILLRVSKDASASDTLKVYNKIEDLRKRLVGGADFNELAKEYSEDPSAKRNGGELGYFKGFMMVKPFEDAAYALAKDSVSKPVRTQFGYHLLQVVDRRSVPGDYKLGHIAKFFPKNVTDEQRERAKQSIDSIHTALVNGADFGELARECSDEKATAANGGVLRWMNGGMLTGTPGEPALKLKSGELAEVYESRYGYHIIKLIEYREPKGFEEMKPELKANLQRDGSHDKMAKQRFINQLKARYSFKKSENIVASVLNNEDVAKDAIIATYLEKTLAVSDFNAYKEKTYTKLSDKEMIEQFFNSELLKYADAHLEEDNTEFRYLVNEYHDGILLFNISQDLVWNKANSDTLGLDGFFASFVPKAKWKERFDGVVVTCPTEDSAQILRNQLKGAVNHKDILTNALKKSEDMLKVDSLVVEQGQNQIVDYYIWKVSAPQDVDISRSVVVGNVKDVAEKTLDEARGFYVLKYQEYLDKKWIESLKSKYKVTVKKKLIRMLQKKYCS